MNQLVVLQEIYASFSKGGDGLQKMDSKTIEGNLSGTTKQIAESTRKGRIDENLCRELSLKLQDVYEIKRLGDICRRAGLQDLAINTYNRAVSLCRDPILRPVLQNNLGRSLRPSGRSGESCFLLSESRRLLCQGRGSYRPCPCIGKFGLSLPEERGMGQSHRALLP